jgi:hypothetical protein
MENVGTSYAQPANFHPDDFKHLVINRYSFLVSCANTLMQVLLPFLIIQFSQERLGDFE